MGLRMPSFRSAPKPAFSGRFSRPESSLSLFGLRVVAAPSRQNQPLTRPGSLCADLFKRLCEHGGPEQKVIIFCTRDLHADRVPMQIQRLYAAWCKENGQTPKDHYAFKCTAEGGSDLIEPMRGSGERCFIACTVDLLATGVDIERLNAVVFFRYLESSILCYQMVERGTRIHKETQKYKFWLYDYTGVTDLIGTDFITAPAKPRIKKPGGDDGGDGGDDGGGGGDDPLPLPEIKTGHESMVVMQARYILQERLVDGVRRVVAVPWMTIGRKWWPAYCARPPLCTTSVACGWKPRSAAS
jgi:type I restriction enzyme, R subunit